MKTKILALTVGTMLSFGTVFAQDITTVNAVNTDISDNLDLRAVASLFGDAANLEDFERRLNNPKDQISNLDLNSDGKVDYLRVIESVEKNIHLVVVQAVLSKDVFQDVATIEVERDRNNNVQIQVVGDVYMYGQNYIYEPVYVSRPIIYNTFWVNSYLPYYSPFYFGFYPDYFFAWNPFPIFRYNRHIHNYINIGHAYNYVNNRRCDRAVYLHTNYRQNGYERIQPNRSFSQRNNNIVNRREYDNNRDLAGIRGRGSNNVSRNEDSRNTTAGTRGNNNNRNTENNNGRNSNRSETVEPKLTRGQQPENIGVRDNSPRPTRNEPTQNAPVRETRPERPTRNEPTENAPVREPRPEKPTRSESIQNAPVRETRTERPTRSEPTQNTPVQETRTQRQESTRLEAPQNNGSGGRQGGGRRR